MKNCISLVGLIWLIVSSCSSKDEPAMEYNGPWQITFYEEYHGIHNNSDEFREWFINHYDSWYAAQFFTNSGIMTQIWYASNNDYIEWEDYSRYYNGYVVWIDYVSLASESDVQSIVRAFEAFTIYNSTDKIYDRFTATYKRSSIQRN